MLVKCTMHFEKYAPGDIADVKVGIARRLLSQGRAVLLSTQETFKMVKDHKNKMVTNINNKAIKSNETKT
jgi:hypothetical protein